MNPREEKSVTTSLFDDQGKWISDRKDYILRGDASWMRYKYFPDENDTEFYKMVCECTGVKESERSYISLEPRSEGSAVTHDLPLSIFDDMETMMFWLHEYGNSKVVETFFLQLATAYLLANEISVHDGDVVIFGTGAENDNSSYIFVKRELIPYHRSGGYVLAPAEFAWPKWPLEYWRGILHMPYNLNVNFAGCTYDMSDADDESSDEQQLQITMPQQGKPLTITLCFSKGDEPLSCFAAALTGPSAEAVQMFLDSSDLWTSEIRNFPNTPWENSVLALRNPREINNNAPADSSVDINVLPLYTLATLAPGSELPAFGNPLTNKLVTQARQELDAIITILGEGPSPYVIGLARIIACYC